MKILFVNAVYGRGSTGIITRGLYNCCWKNHIDAYVAYPKGQGYEKCSGYEIGSLIDHKLHALLSRIAGKQAYFSIVSTRFFIKYIERIKPEIVHLHNLHSNYIHLNMLLKYLAEKDIITVITMHDCWYFTGGCFHYANVNCSKWQDKCGSCPKRKDDTSALLYDATSSILIDRKSYLNAIPRLVLVGCSNWVSNECRKSVLSNRDIRTIYNGFDLKIFHPVDSLLRKDLSIQDKFVILAPASKWLSALNKNVYTYFLENLSENMVLVLFGCKKDEMLNSSRVIKLGFIHSQSDMAKLYSMADVFVNCSHEDTLSSLNLESQACGTPVVSYDATGNQETVGENCGFVVNTGDYIQLYEKTLLVQKMGKRFFSKACQNFIRTSFDMESNFQKYIELYRECISVV